MEKLFKSLQKQQLDARELVEQLTSLENEGKLKVNSESKKGGEECMGKAVDLALVQSKGLLHLAIATNDSEIVEVVLKQKGVDVNRPDSDSQWPPLIYSIITCSDKDIIKLLLSYKADVSKPDIELGYSAVHWAAKLDNVLVLQLLYGRSPAVNKPSVETEDTPLHMACIDRAERAASFLISKGADLNSQNLKGETPIHIAVRQQLPNLVLQMLDTKTVNVDDCVDVLGNSPLHLSRGQNLDALSKLLQARGFSPEKKNKAGLTPNDIMENLNEQEKRENEMKTAAKEDKFDRKNRERDSHMSNTEVTKFCECYGLEDLIGLFYLKKIFFVDDYFEQIDESKLKKFGATLEQRERFFAALKKRQEDIEEEIRRTEREALHQEMMRRRWKQFSGVGKFGSTPIERQYVGIVFAFVLIFTFLKFVEYQRGVKSRHFKGEL